MSEEVEAKKQIQEAAKVLYLLGWRSKDVKFIVGMHKCLSGDEVLKAMNANWDRPNHSLNAIDWTEKRGACNG